MSHHSPPSPSFPTLRPAPPVDLDLYMSQLRRAVETESPTSDQSALADSARVFSEIGRELLGESAQTETVDGFPHLLWRFGSGPRKVLLIGHHDTVWPLGTIDRLPFRVEDGKIFGPGTDDMKGGDLVALHALARLRAQLGTLDGITLLITADEETGSLSSRHIIEREAAQVRATLVFESGGESGEVKVARKGMSRYELHIVGRAAHAGVEPEKGINATVEAARQILDITTLANPELETTVVPTFTHSGTTGNTVPARATVWIDSRAALSDEQLRVDRALNALHPHLPGAGLELTGGINRPPWERSVSAGVFARAARVAQELGHDPLQAISVGGGSDGNFAAAMGIPTLDGLGTVGGGSHADHEHSRIDSIVPRIELTAALILDLLRDAPDCR